VRPDVAAVVEHTAKYLRPVTVAEVSADLGMERHTTRRALDLAVTEGHVVRLEQRPGHTATYAYNNTVDEPARGVVWLRGTLDQVAAGLVTVERRIRMQAVVTEVDADTLQRLAGDLAEAAAVAGTLG
jgi:DNA-binding transcriptional regulator LsrR (DeoR family)